VLSERIIVRPKTLREFVVNDVFLSKMLSGVNVFEISDIQEDETLRRLVHAAPNVTMLHYIP